ncbi:MAG: HesA/MoeB/ThiF family protein [Desulfitobacteriaceae bacterium]
MEKGKFSERYKRNQRSISLDDQVKLKDSTVAIVGCGGLGGYLAEEMARLGVGRLVLVDGDRVDETNLNRQLLATEANIGQWKVEAGKERLHIVNSETRVDVIRDWFREEDPPGIMFVGVDLVCDALDTISARLALERTCHSLGIPLVFASIAGWFGLVGVSFPGEHSVARLFGKTERGVETTWGNPAFTPAVVASLAVAEGVKVLTGKPLSLHRSWLQIDLLAMEFERFEILE